MTGMKQPLTNSREEEIILYDMAALVSLDARIASGYVSLLSPSKAGKKKQDQENAYLLAFTALTDGNVVDACFGLQAYVRQDPDHNGTVFCRRAKSLIAQSADTSESVPNLAVDTYRQAFEIVVETQQKLQKLNFLIRCFFSGGILRSQRESIQKSFSRLEESIQAST